MAIFLEPTNVVAYDYILDLIEKQVKKDNNPEELWKKRSEIIKEKLDFEKQTGVKCFICEKKLGWMNGFGYSEEKMNGILSDEILKGMKQKSRVCGDCYKSIEKRSTNQSVQETPDKKMDEKPGDGFGKIIKQTATAQYYGGHNAYIAGGTFGDAQNGVLVLTEKYLIFTKNAIRESKKWRIVIPLDKVIIGDWKIDEKVRRKSMAGGGVGFGLFGGAGTIHDTGKSHDIVVPYVDEHGMDQAPRFGVSSITGNAIREWAKLIYDTLVQIQKNKPEEVKEVKTVETKNSDEDPLKVLKLRLVKGEISKEEFEEFKELID